MGDLMTTPAPQAGRAPRRRAQHKTLTDSTGAVAAVKNRLSALRTRACTRSLKALAAVMGIDAETATRLLELIKTDAASRPSGKVRTKAVLAAAEAEGLHVNGTAIKILAGFCGLQTERGAEAGKGHAGPGRPTGSRDRRPRGTPRQVARSPRSDRGQRRVGVTCRQAIDAYEATKDEAGRGSLRRAAANLGVSSETVRALIEEARQTLGTDEKITKVITTVYRKD
jgi:plasmid maintenance system antidote protein VapI